MKIQDISNLIEIRSYAARMQDNYSLKKEDVKKLTSIVVMLDKKITEYLTSDDFGKLINMEEAPKVMEEFIYNNNIKNKLNPSNKVVTVEDGKVTVHEGK